MPTYHDFSKMTGCFLFLWYSRVETYGTQRGIITSYTMKIEVVDFLRGLPFPPMVEADSHSIDSPRRNYPGRGAAASLATRDMVAEVNYPVVPIKTDTQETRLTPEISQTIVFDEAPSAFDNSFLRLG